MKTIIAKKVGDNPDVLIEEKERLFMGVFPTGLSFADRYREEHGDYKRLAFLDFARLELTIEKDCPAELVDRIQEDAKKIICRRGETYRISASGQSVILGSALL